MSASNDRVAAMRAALAKALRLALEITEQESRVKKESVESQIGMSWDEFDSQMQTALNENSATPAKTSDRPYLQISVNRQDNQLIEIAEQDEVKYSIALDHSVQMDRLAALYFAKNVLNLKNGAMHIEATEDTDDGEIHYLIEVNQNEATYFSDTIFDWLRNSD